MKNSKYNVDLTNKKFGHLLVIERVPTKNPILYDSWKCICDCGNNVIAYSYNLIHGSVHCCGPTHKDLVGEKFSNLTVIKRLKNSPGNNDRLWLCTCDCGNTKIVSTVHLKNGIIKDCGCKKKPRKHDLNHYLTSSTIYNLFVRYKNKAKKRNISFKINESFFEKIIKLNCAYCNNPPIKYNGIDRVDNCKGYTVDNCVPCCKFCNRAKSNKSLEDFISWGIKLGNNLDLLYPDQKYL